MNFYNKNFIIKLKNNSGRGSSSSFLVKSKANKKSFFYFLHDLNRNWSTLLSVIIGLKLNNLNNIIGLIKYSNGSLSTIKIANGLNLGNYIKSTYFPLKLYKINLLGFRVFLSLLKQNMIFFDLGKYNNNSKFIKSNGTFSQVLRINKELNLVLVQLPSGNKKYFPSDYLCTLGRNSNIFKKFSIIGKAGLNRNLGKNVIVRGVAMNPVDHPHGGRTKTNKPEVSPWGWVTKHSH